MKHSICRTAGYSRDCPIVGYSPVAARIRALVVVGEMRKTEGCASIMFEGILETVVCTRQQAKFPLWS